VCLQVSKTCFQVSGSGKLQMEQVMLGYIRGPKNNCFRALSMYRLYLNLRMQVFWKFCNSRVFPKAGRSCFVYICITCPFIYIRKVVGKLAKEVFDKVRL
jgi:hypothetical protein